MENRSIAIIDKVGSKTNDEINVPLLWAACISSKYVHASGLCAERFHFLLSFDNFTERQRFSFYVDSLKNRPEDNEEAIREITNLYTEIVKIRSIKRKQKELIVAQAKAEKTLKTIFAEVKANVHTACEQLKLSALFPLACNNSEKHDKPLLAWFFPTDDAETSKIARIQVTSGNVILDNAFPLLPGIIKQQLTHATMQDAVSNMAGVEFMDQLLLEFPEPLDLNNLQVLALRNDVSQASDNLFTALEKLNKDLREVPFEPEEFANMLDLYNTHIVPQAFAMQKSLDENADLQTVKKEGNKKTYQLYVALSSNQTILNIFNQLAIIDLDTLAYAGEEVSEHKNPEHTRLFLYLEIKEQ